MNVLAAQGKVSLKVYPDPSAHHVILKISDTGCGIPPEKLAMIFNSFQQVRPEAFILWKHLGL